MLLSQASSIPTHMQARSQIREIARPAMPCATRPALLPNVTTPLERKIVPRDQRAIRPPSAAAISSGVPTAGTASGPKVIDHVYDVIVVGGGLSGLVTGQTLAAQHGVNNFLVTEARERVGGNITSLASDGYVWEEGPNSFQPNDSMLQVAVGREGWWQVC